jgi:hypothetical protein
MKAEQKVINFQLDSEREFVRHRRRDIGCHGIMFLVTLTKLFIPETFILLSQSEYINVLVAYSPGNLKLFVISI